MSKQHIIPIITLAVSALIVYKISKPLFVGNYILNIKESGLDKRGIKWD